jgi:hypothetical protein
MFEKTAGREEKDRSRVIMIISGLAVLVVVALIVIVTQVIRPSQPVEMERVVAIDDPETRELQVDMLCPPENIPQTEAQAYVPKIAFIGLQKLTGGYENFKNKYARIMGTVKNDGDRVIEGLRLRMILYGQNCEVLKEKIMTIIPDRKSSLAPGDALPVDISIDRIPDPSEIKTMRLEPYGLKLKKAG